MHQAGHTQLPESMVTQQIDTCMSVTVIQCFNSLRPTDYITIIGSYDGLSPGRHQSIIWTIAGILLNRPMGTNFREI